MTNIGKITGTLEQTATSPEVEIGGAKWYGPFNVLHWHNFRSICRNGSYFEIRCAVGDGTNALWNCTARGRLTAWSSINEKKTAVWTSSFDFLNTKDGYAHSERISFSLPRNPVNFEAEVEVIKLQVSDLSSDDGVCFEVDGEKLWLSKKVLSVHSPVLEAMFSADFKEKATGMCSPKEVNIVDFKMFMSVLYNLDIRIDEQESLEGLLRLGDMWQCDSVLRFCRDIIGSSDSTFLSLKDKLELCERHGFCPLLATIIEKANLKELKALVKDGCCAQFSRFALNVILHRLAS
uniref:BTB domain-containing protein n=1 Tax=Steinernema glaseri TaxID=37863 RepID=A0A1I8APY7_9BILA